MGARARSLPAAETWNALCLFWCLSSWWKHFAFLVFHIQRTCFQGARESGIIYSAAYVGLGCSYLWSCWQILRRGNRIERFIFVLETELSSSCIQSSQAEHRFPSN